VNVEIVEVPAGGPDDQDLAPLGASFSHAGDYTG
jgi:hypothetical protein